MEDAPRPPKPQPMQMMMTMALQQCRRGGLVVVLRQQLTKRLMTQQHCRPTVLPVQS